LMRHFIRPDVKRVKVHRVDRRSNTSPPHWNEPQGRGLCCQGHHPV
jgi:hypothetical protein